MGKNQSKHSLGFYRRRPGPNGECFGSHGHFNPLAVTEGEDLLVIRSFSSKVESDGNCGVAVVKVDSGLDESDKCPLQVILPPEGPRDTDSCATKRKMSEAITLPDTDKNTTTELSVEEFECNVSVKADTGMERQEFLFTLYDLDGHGKITKDDIAGLVRSIYEAVGTSIKLPVTGSKTIKVRLTVSPDKKAVVGTKEHEDGEEEKDGDAHEKLVRCLSVLGGVSDAIPPPIPPCPAQPPTPPPREPSCHHRHHHHHHHNNHQNPNRNNETGPCSSPRRKTRFTSAASLQRNELLEILQANLEKNSLGYQPIRKHQRSRQPQQQQTQHHHACGQQQQQQSHNHHHHHRNRTVECRDRRNHYLDLAGVENFALKLGNVHRQHEQQPQAVSGLADAAATAKEAPSSAACPYVLLDRSHVCSKGGRRTKKGHHRSRSHDLNGGAAATGNLGVFLEGDDAIWQRINNDNNNKNHEYGRSKSYDAALHPTVNWGCAGPNPNPDPDATSPRAHNRHRHRDRDREREREHARAMQQVAHWIQQGHIGGLGSSSGGGGGGGGEDLGPNAKSPGKNGNPVLVERHEHHHVHHHHHYHYKDL